MTGIQILLKATVSDFKENSCVQSVVNGAFLPPSSIFFIVNLAVSLHAPDQKLRRELVPVPGASVNDIIAAVRHHNRQTGSRVTFEYVLLKDVNDSRAHARRLAERIRGIRAHINLIPLNPSPGVVGARPSRRATLGFQDALQERGVAATVRVEQGRDISAACGQLRGDRVRADA